MKNYLKSLFSDYKNIPSVRLHIAVILTILVVIKIDSLDLGKLSAILGAITTLAGISVFDKGDKNDNFNKQE